MRNLLLLLIIVYFNPVLGQQYSSFWYNSENGLPQNSVKDITKDQSGFIWLSTDGGIVRYDGYTLLNYNNLKFSNLNFYFFQGNISRNQIINSNIEEQQYIEIRNRRVTLKNRSQIKGQERYFNYKNKSFLALNKINFTSQVDNIFCIKVKNGTYYFEDGSVIYHKNNAPDNIIVKITFSLKDFKKIFSHGETLFFRNSGNKDIIAVENGRVFHVPSDPLYNDPNTKIFWQQFNSQVFVVNRGKVYISKYINGKLNLDLLVHLKNAEIDFGTLSSVFYDKEYDNLYLGTLNKGLCIIKTSAFHTSKKEISLENRIYYTALPFNENSIINTQGRVFDQDHLLKDLHFNPNDNLFSITYDNSENIIYPKNNYIYRRLKNSDFEKTDSTFIGKSVMAIFEGKGIYALQLGNSSPYLLNIYTNDGFQNPAGTLSSSYPINTVRVLNRDLLLIGRTDGLFVYSRAKKALTQISSLNIKNIVSTSGGNFWVISRGEGLYLLQNNKLIKMPYDDNGYISSPHNVLEDKNGFLWIPTNNGLFKVSKNKLLEYAKNQETDIFYYRYSKKEGFNTNEFNGTGTLANTAALKNGQFVLPSMDGYVFFDPLKISSHYPKAENIYIERAKSKGSEPFYFKDTLNLENDFGTASVYIDVPYYSNNDNLYIEASLQNGDGKTKWQKLKNREYILNNLSPGNYGLTIRVLISPEGKFAYRKIFISIPALFYQTLWFRILFIVSFLGLILFVIFLRTRNLTTKNNQLKKIVGKKNDELKSTQDQLKNESEYQKNLIQTINHDITTPIKYLSVMSQKLSETENPKLQKQYFDTIYKSSEELYKFTLNLKNYTELFSTESKAKQEEFYPVYDILEDKKLLFEEIALQKDTVIINNSPKNIQLNFNENILAAILHNLLDNAVKNTFSGEIILNAKAEKNFIVISISDTGAGMSRELLEYYNHLIKNIQNKPSSFKNHGLGLHLVVQLLKKIGGKIIFGNNTPKGTIAEIIIQNQS